MTLVVDTCILLDILDEDPVFGLGSAQCLNAQQENELIVSPATYVELAPAFLGDRRLQDQFLDGLGIHVASYEPGVLNRRGVARGDEGESITFGRFRSTRRPQRRPSCIRSPASALR